MDLEERLAGTGIGGKTLQAFAESQGLDTGTAIKRLADIGIEAAPTDKIKAIAAMVGTGKRRIFDLYASMIYTFVFSDIIGRIVIQPIFFDRRSR